MNVSEDRQQPPAEDRLYAAVMAFRDEMLAQITDIEYFQNKLFASLRVPKAYLGFERDVNSKSTLTTQDVQFARTLRRVRDGGDVGGGDGDSDA